MKKQMCVLSVFVLWVLLCVFVCVCFADVAGLLLFRVCIYIYTCVVVCVSLCVGLCCLFGRSLLCVCVLSLSLLVLLGYCSSV